MYQIYALQLSALCMRAQTLEESLEEAVSGYD